MGQESEHALAGSWAMLAGLTWLQSMDQPRSIDSHLRRGVLALPVLSGW